MPWHAKPTGVYAMESTEAYDNAVMAWSIMNSLGWTLAAFCGMWGNVGSESEWNPWRWEGDVVLPEGDPRIYYQNSHAYGLVQWDWAGKYIDGGVGYPGYGPNYADKAGSINDGTAQMYFLDATAESSGQYFPYPGKPYQLSYAQYKAADINQYSVDWLVHAWFWNYERGTWSDLRVRAGNYWYNTLGGITPPPPPVPGGRIPIWLMFKIRERNR